MMFDNNYEDKVLRRLSIRRKKLMGATTTSFGNKAYMTARAGKKFIVKKTKENFFSGEGMMKDKTSPKNHVTQMGFMPRKNKNTRNDKYDESNDFTRVNDTGGDDGQFFLPFENKEYKVPNFGFNQNPGTEDNHDLVSN
jgi:hypothetical protein